MALTDNLQAFYKLSDLTDSSGNNRTLTNNGNVTFAPGKIGDAMSPNSDYLYVENLSNLVFNGGVTFSAWVKPFSRGEMGIIGFDSNQSLSVIDQQGQVYSDLGHGAFNGSFVSENTSSIALNEWSLVVARWNEATKEWSVTVNDTKVTISQPSLTVQNVSPTKIIVGGILRDGYLPDNFFDGQIDAVGIWNRALSDAEVAELYNNGTGLELNPPNYRGEWDNFTDYGQDDVVSVSGVYWKLTGLGGWTVGGAPGLGYGWTLLAPAPVGGKVSLSGRISLSGRVKFAV